jgi:GNAT superfamily N-acetyltransferase
MNIAACLARVSGRVLSSWGELGWAILLERSLLEELPRVESSAEVTLRLALPADIDEITRLYSTDSWLYLVDGPPTPASHERARDLYLDRLRRGELCFLATSGGAVAHVNWICLTWAEALPGHPIRLRCGEVYTTDAYTPPAFRGRGLHAFVLRAMLDHARAHGYRHAYTLARRDRPNAQKGLFQLGWRECGRILYFLPLGRAKAWLIWRQGNLEPLFRQP